MAKVYPLKRKRDSIGLAAICLVLFIFLAFVGPLVGATLPYLGVVMLVLAWINLLLAIVSLLDIFLGFTTRKVILSEEGVIFKRRFRPIIIQKITDLKVVEKSLKIVGLTPEGKEVRRIIRRMGDVGKRWEEFKKDLQKFESKNNT